MTDNRHAVTGAFGYSGRQIAKRLLKRDYEVVTVTSKPPQPDFVRATNHNVPAHV